MSGSRHPLWESARSRAEDLVYVERREPSEKRREPGGLRKVVSMYTMDGMI